MPYDGEFAAYKPLKRIVEADRVRSLLKRARVQSREEFASGVVPQPVPPSPAALPNLVVAIDGSRAEVDVETGYPGAKVGYCTVASVMLNLGLLDELDKHRPVDPVKFRTVERAATIDAALPGCNVVTRDHVSARDAFREAVFDTFHDNVVDSDDHLTLQDTFEHLLSMRPGGRAPACPYEHVGCEERVPIGAGLTTCTCEKRRPIYSTDALRIHERFNEIGSNGEAFGEVMSVWERVLVVHLLRSLERKRLLGHAGRLALVLDGPLALFGHPAWLSQVISTELKRLNTIVRREAGTDLLIIGVEKAGNFVTHFEELDKTSEPGVDRFAPGTYLMPTNRYIKERIIYSTGDKPWGKDTYFGRKFFLKSGSGARIVASIPYLSDEQHTTETDDISLYPSFPAACGLLEKLVSSRYPNAVTPIVTAHAHAAIPLNLGGKVLEQLAKALMGK